MEGSYHGHHDTVMVSIGVDIDGDIGDRDDASCRTARGSRSSTVDLVHAVPFNNAAALDARLERARRRQRGLRDHGSRR